MQKLSLGEVKRRLERFSAKGLQNATKEIILNDHEIVFQKQDEFTYGQNPDGSDIGEYSNSPIGREYKIFKQSINPLAGGKVDLILTGSTKKHLKVISLGNGEFALISTDPKWNGLVEKYGEQIKRINKGAFIELQRNNYAPKLIHLMRKITKL